LTFLDESSRISNLLLYLDIQCSKANKASTWNKMKWIHLWMKWNETKNEMKPPFRFFSSSHFSAYLFGPTYCIWAYLQHMKWIIFQILFVVTFFGLLIWASVALSRINYNHSNDYYNNPYDQDINHDHSWNSRNSWNSWNSWNSRTNYNYNRDYRRPIQFRTDDGRLVIWDPFAYSDGLDRTGALAIIIVMSALICIQVIFQIFQNSKYWKRSKGPQVQWYESQNHSRTLSFC
jgi:hypothetical protein